MIDELSGRIHLSEAFAPLWTSTLPTSTCSILSRRAVEELGGRIGTEPVAQSGRYIMTEWVPRQRVVVTRAQVNPDVEVLGKQQEAILLRQDMEQELSGRILTRIRARLR